MKITIRKAKLKDIFGIYSVAKTSNQKIGLRFFIKNFLYPTFLFLKNKRTCFVALDKKEIIGSISIHHLNKNVLGVWIKPKYRSQGIGTKLINSILKECGSQRIILSTERDNLVAQALYRKFGFKEDLFGINMVREGDGLI